MSDPRSDRLRQYFVGCYPGAVVSDVEFIVSGWESDVYAFSLQRPSESPKSLILRLYSGEGAAAKQIREAAGLSHLHQAGYSAPAILLYESDAAILGGPFTVMEKVDGRALWPILATVEPSHAEHLLDRFGHLLADLHHLDWRPFTEKAALYEADPAATLHELIDSARELYTRFGVLGFLAIVDWLEKHKAEIAARPAVVHLDFHANNVLLCDDDRLAVIDWTQITVSDYRVDLAWTLMIMGDYGQPEWGERILEAYGVAAGAPVEDLDYFQVIACTKLLASTVISLKASPSALGMRPETVESIERQAPILRKLYQRVQGVTGLTVPELESALEQQG